MDYYFSFGAGPVGVPIVIPGRSAVWNVFPLAEIPADDWMTGQPMPSDAEAPAFPFPFVPALAGTADADAEPTPNPTPTAEPTPKP